MMWKFEIWVLSETKNMHFFNEYCFYFHCRQIILNFIRKTMLVVLKKIIFKFSKYLPKSCLKKTNA